MDNFLKELGINKADNNINTYFEVPNRFLIEETIRTGKGHLSSKGALVVKTGKFTGRAANDKYVVKTPTTENTIWWENSVNEMTPENFKKLKNHIIDYFNQQQDLYITENNIGAHTEYNINARLITTGPSHALFSNYLFRKDNFNNFDPSSDFTILHAPGLDIDPNEFGTKSKTVITTCFDTNTTLIVGTFYAGEIKKSMFSVMNYRLTDLNVLPMHAGANTDNKNTSVFFGLSGTGKTTLSTDEGKLLIGDDEHGLCDSGIFNFEGGCYAKTYKLSKHAEPGIYKATGTFGSIVENVVMDPTTGYLDFYDDSITENGRSSYPLSFIDQIEQSAQGCVPNNIFFLTADAFGVLPPVSKLTNAQAMFYFVLGYTAKLAGTEAGITKPVATFSPCFGAPFMMRHPKVYADLLGEYIEKYNIQTWLINTGWTGGASGAGGTRYQIAVTRQIIRDVQDGKAQNIKTETDPIFGLQIPHKLPGVRSATILFPQKAWKDSDTYIKQAQSLAASFHQQMEQFGSFYTDNMPAAPIYIGK